MKSESDYSIATIAIFIFGLILAVVTTYGYFYLPFIPRHYDQTISILNFYDGYYAWKDSTTPFASFLHSLGTQQTFKGGIGQAVGLIASVIIGPNRYALLFTNLLALMLFLTTAYSFAAKKLSVAISLLLTALCLMGSVLYMPAGGIFDLRWDFAGIMVFSCYVLLLATFIHRDTRASFFALAAFALLAINVRSISAVFICTSLAMAFLAFCLLAINKKWRPYALARVRSVFLVGVITGSFYVLFGTIFWKDIDAYYLSHLRTGEHLVRMEEFGAQSGLFAYYLSTALELNRKYFAYAASVLLILWGMWGFKRLHPRRIGNPRADGAKNATSDPLDIRWRIEGVTIAVLSSLAVLIPVAMFSPSPIMPAYITGACVLLTICVAPPIREGEGRRLYWWVIMALALFAILRISSLQSWSKAELASHAQLTELYGSVVLDHPNGALLHFSVIDEAVLPSAFWIWLYEHGSRDKRDKFSATTIGLLPLSLDAYVVELMATDAVFKWESVAPKPTYYPSEDQLRGDFGAIAWSKVSSQFAQRQTIPYKDGVLAYYIRKVRLTRMTTPYGLDGSGNGAFWLGNENATLTFTSESASDAYVLLKVSRGPSLPSDAKVNICLTQKGLNKNCLAVESAVHEVRFPVALIAGESSMQLSVSISDRVTPRPVPHDPRNLWLRISDIRAR